MNLRTLHALTPFALLLAATAAHGHDFWIAPDRFRLEPGTTIGVGLEVGDHFDGQPVPRRADHLERFGALSPDGTATEIAGAWGDDPAGTFRPDTTGVWRLVYTSHANQHTMNTERFARYLAEEGLDEALAAHREARAAEDSGAVRELYYRTVKALVEVSPGSETEAPPAAGLSQPAGLPLELVPEGDPRVGDMATPVAFRLLFQDRPVPGALVVARAAAMPSLAPSARTDAEGRVELRLPMAGPWLVKAVVMLIEPADDAEVDWRSWWTSLTFERHGG